MSEESPPVAVGEVVAGKYRIDHVLGSGGMGIVVAAMQLELERPVAIKFLLRAAAKNAEVVARFSREARAAARMQGEHVARVLDVGALPDGLPYMVMEHLEGADLSQRMAQQRQLPLEEVARIVIEACDALAEAHAASIVHRDLKPANLFLARRPDRTTVVKLLDFGISKAPTDAAGITSTQAVIGSPVYMSPEQLVSAKNVDSRSDVWSLGVVLYEALAGAPPFSAESMPQIVTRILHTPAPRLAQARPDLPPQVDQLVAACLEKDPAARLQNVAQLAAGLAPFTPDGARLVERIGRVLGHEAPPPPSVVAPSGPPPPTVPMQAPLPPIRSDVDAWGTTQTLPRRSSLPWLVAGVLGACGIIGVAAAVVVTRTRHPFPQRSPAMGEVQAPASAAAAVTLTPPPAEPPAATPASEPPPTSAPTSHGRPAATAHGRPAAGAPVAAAPVVSATPAPAPTPTQEPVDPLHMGLK